MKEPKQNKPKLILKKPKRRIKTDKMKSKQRKEVNKH